MLLTSSGKHARLMWFVRGFVTPLPAQAPSVCQTGGIRSTKSAFQPPQKYSKNPNTKYKKCNLDLLKITFYTSNCLTFSSKKGLSQLEVQKLSKSQVLYFYLETLFFAPGGPNIPRFLQIYTIWVSNTNCLF